LAFGRFSAASFGFGAYIFGVLLFGFAGSRLASIFDGFNNAFHRLEQAYARLLKVLIDRRRLILMGLASGIVVTAIAFNALPSAFIPEEDQGYGLGIFQLQNGASLSQTQKVAEQIAKVLDEEDDIISGSVISGAGFNGNSPDQGLFFYGFKPLEERSGASNKAPAIVARLNKKLSQFDTGLAVAAQPPAIPGFSAQGGFYFQFNDLSNGAYTFTQLNDLAQQLVSTGQSSGEFSSLYTQFVPSAPPLA
jgi:multidrug efflux pump subunit AcrB